MSVEHSLTQKNTSLREIIAADLTLLLVAAAWGAGIPFTADLAREISPVWGIALRMSLAGVCMALFFPRRMLKATGGEWGGGFCLALFLTVVYLLASFGLVYSTASKQAFIIGFSVLFVPFLVWFFHGKRPSNALFAGAALATVGLSVMGFTPGMRFNFGDMLSLVMSLIAAGHILVIGYYARRHDPTTLVLIQLVIVGVILLAIAFIFEPVPDFSSLSRRLWYELIFVSMVCTIICFTLQTRAQKTSPESHVAIILSTESLFGYVIAIGIGQDPFHLQGAIGGLCILGGVILSEAETILKAKKI